MYPIVQSKMLYSQGASKSMMKTNVIKIRQSFAKKYNTQIPGGGF